MGSGYRAPVKLALGVGVLVVPLLCPMGARAEESRQRLTVEWRAPTPCPTAAELERAIGGHLGHSLHTTGQQPLAVTADVVEAGGHYRVRLRFESRSGVEERSLEHPDCSKLLDAAALLVALAIDPRGVTERQSVAAPPAPVGQPTSEDVQTPSPGSSATPGEPPRPLAPPPRAAKEPARTSPRAASTDASRPRAPQVPWEYLIGAFGLVGAGALPGAAPGVGVDFAVRRQHFELGVVGRYWLPRSQPVAETPNAAVSLSWSAVEVRACGVPWLGAWRLRLCAASGGGDLSARGLRVAASRTRHTFVPTLSAAALLSYRAGRISPHVGLVADWLLVQPRYGVIQDTDTIEVFQPSAAAVSGVVGLSFRLEP